jgi:hypothetical protein
VIYRANDKLLGTPLLRIIGIPQQGNGLALLGSPIFAFEGLYAYLHFAQVFIIYILR